MHRTVLTCLFATLLLVFAPGCDSTPETQADDEPTEQTVQQDDEAAAPAEIDELDEETRQAALTDPDKVTDRAPDEYQVRFETTQGEFTVAVNRQWAPNGADRFFNLVRIGYYDDIAFFRVIDGFMAQFGIHGDPEVNEVWRTAEIEDDQVNRSNERGKVTFATRGPNTRTTQLFINLTDNPDLDAMGFSPIGEVVDGMDVVERLYSGYGEGAPEGDGPDQQRAQQEGNDYLKAEFESLDWTTDVSIVQ